MYQSPWQWDDAGRPKLMTGENWLAESAHVWDTLGDKEEDTDDDCASQADTLRAIAKEITTLRTSLHTAEQRYAALYKYLPAITYDFDGIGYTKFRLKAFGDLQHFDTLDDVVAAIIAKEDQWAAEMAKTKEQIG